jgi:hypothetical protein
VAAVHDHRSFPGWRPLVLVAVVFILCWRVVLVVDDLLGLVAGGGQPGCFRQVALTWRVIASQQLRQFGG